VFLLVNLYRFVAASDLRTMNTGSFALTKS
jgi:hypothetical protein